MHTHLVLVLLVFVQTAGFPAFASEPRAPGVQPLARSGHALVYDAGCGKDLLSGGVNDSGDLSDFWEWDGTAWHPIVTTGPGPGPRAGHRMAYEAGGGDVHLFGGDSDGHRDWTWDGTTWEPVEGPAPTRRSLAAMA